MLMTKWTRNKNNFTEMEIIIMKQSKIVCVCLKNGLVESASN